MTKHEWIGYLHQKSISDLDIFTDWYLGEFCS